MRIVRIAMLLLGLVLIGPSVASVLATGGLANQYAFKAASAAPAEAFTVSGIEFALQRGDNATPVNPSNRFAFGPRRIWAFWSWDDAKSGSKVNYVLRLGSTDVAWGTIPTDNRNGRMEVELERLDGDFLGIGTYRLYLDASGGESGSIRTAEFEIYDPDRNGNNNNGNSNNNNGNDNGGNNNNRNDNGGNNNNHNDNGGNNNNRNDNGGNNNNRNDNN